MRTRAAFVALPARAECGRRRWVQRREQHDQGPFEQILAPARHGKIAAGHCRRCSGVWATRLPSASGGTIRALGGLIQQMGGGLEGLGDAVSGSSEHTRDDDPDIETSAALRSIASRPIRVVGRALRAVGDTTNFLGDTTERVASEVIGIFPDTVRVVESSVRTIREKIDGDDLDEGDRMRAEDSRANGRGRRLEARGGEHSSHAMSRNGMGGAPGGTDQTATVHTVDPEEAASAAAAVAAAAATAATPPARSRRKVWFLGGRGSVRAWLWYWPLSPRQPANQRTAILGLLVLLSLLYLGKVEAEQRKALREEVAAEERQALFLNGPAGVGAPLVAEPVGWLNALIASGWQEMIVPYLTESAVDEIEATLDDLILPKSIKAISLDDLQLGPRPPLIRSLAAAPAPSLSRPTANGGCVAQLEIEWEAPDAYASLAFRLANVQSQPRLRLRRARLRGTVRVHFEWLRGYPYVGCVRFTFVKPPEISDFALEPLGNIDVTVLPGIGSWIRDALVASALKFATMPNWVETDMRAPSRVPKKRSSPAAVPEEPQPQMEAFVAPSSVPAGFQEVPMEQSLQPPPPPLEPPPPEQAPPPPPVFEDAASGTAQPSTMPPVVLDDDKSSKRPEQDWTEVWHRQRVPRRVNPFEDPFEASAHEVTDTVDATPSAPVDATPSTPLDATPARKKEATGENRDEVGELLLSFFQ